MNTKYALSLGSALVCLGATAWPVAAFAQGGLKVAPQMLTQSPRVAAVKAGSPVAADHIVAVVNSEPVTRNEVRARMERIEQQAQRNGATLPSRDELAREVLEALILEKAQVQLAAELGVKVDEAMVDDAERSVARQNQLTVEQMHQQLKAQGQGLAQFRGNLRQQLTLQRLREREVEAGFRVSEADIDRYVAQKTDNPGADLQIHIAQVLVSVPENPEPQQLAILMARAQLVAEKARQGANFAALAREYSDAPDKASGGSLGLRAGDRYPSLFIDATRSVPVDGVAGPVRSPAGFHILKVLEKRVAGLPDAVATQTLARHILLRTSAQRTERDAATQLAEWRKQIEAGKADFSTLAKAHSQDSSASQGGDLGWMGSGVFVPEFEEVMNSLSPGQLSEPTLSRFGVHLIQVMERRQVNLSPREQREQLRAVVREQKLDEAYTKWLENLRARAYVEYRDAPQ